MSAVAEMLPAMCKTLATLAILLLPLVLSEEVVQGSQGAEDDAPSASMPLRSQKVNAIWDKAQKRISDEEKLKVLAVELQTLDDEYMALKKAKSEDSDPLGENEAALTAKTEALLHNYDLWDDFKDAHVNGTLDRGTGGRESALRKLDSLVDRARRAGFTEEELTDLQAEIEHHKKKMDEYEQLRVEYEELARQTNRIPETIEASDSAHEEHDKMKTVLKEKHRDIRHGYEKLKVLSENPVPLKDIGFTDPKLIKLWADALKANFSSAELQSLKVELSHLQEKMLKHQALKEEASLVKKQLKKQARGNGGKEPVAEGTAAAEALRAAADRHEQLSDDADKYGHEVKKYVRDIKNKIKDARLRTEL